MLRAVISQGALIVHLANSATMRLYRGSANYQSAKGKVWALDRDVFTLVSGDLNNFLAWFASEETAYQIACDLELES